MTGAKGPSVVCKRVRCDRPVSSRRVTLLNPRGERTRTCGPYCDEDTDALLRVLTHRYATGGPALIVEQPANAGSAPVSERDG